jgi:hypothetical protein
MEDNFSQNIITLINDLMGRLAREELAEDYLDDEAMTLLMDKETCMGIVSLSHDMHIGKILKHEDEARNSEIKRFTHDVQVSSNSSSNSSSSSTQTYRCRSRS